MLVKNNKKPSLASWEAQQALAILAVDNIRVSSMGLDLMKRKELGLITSEQAIEELRETAKNIKKLKPH